MFRGGSKKKTSPLSKAQKEPDVEVEVSLDVTDNLYSIVVTEDTRLQSVMSVPNEDGDPRRSRFQQIKAAKVDPEVALAMKLSKAAPCRLADSLRPLSPTPADRHSALEESHSTRGRGRESHSCPPALDRNRSGFSASRASVDRAEQYREHSCPPSLKKFDNGKSKSGHKPTKIPSTKSAKKSKDLVSKTASRSRFFGSMLKASHKVIPAPL